MPVRGARRSRRRRADRRRGSRARSSSTTSVDGDLAAPSPSRTTRACGADSTARRSSVRFARHSCTMPMQRVGHEHEAEQRVLRLAEHEDQHEHRAEDRVEPCEDVRAGDLDRTSGSCARRRGSRGPGARDRRHRPPTDRSGRCGEVPGNIARRRRVGHDVRTVVAPGRAARRPDDGRVRLGRHDHVLPPSDRETGRALHALRAARVPRLPHPGVGRLTVLRVRQARRAQANRAHPPDARSATRSSRRSCIIAHQRRRSSC